MLKIGTLKLESRLIMAPMAGITNKAFRLMVKRLGAAMVTTEMVSAAGLCRGNKRSFDYLKTHPAEKPLAVQLFGSNADEMGAAAQIAVEAGADLVDINMGCPVKKVTKTGAGAALLKDLQKIARLVMRVRSSCKAPLTAKIRSGWSPADSSAPQIARILEDCGVDGITVHPRFATQGYSCPADWSVISEVKQEVSIPVIGNGDVFKPEQAIRMLGETGCDGIMIGRGAIGNPWIFKQILSLQEGRLPEEPGIEERRSFIMEHFKLLAETVGEHRAALSMRGLLTWYSKGLPNSSLFRALISKIRDMNSLIGAMDRYFASLEEVRP
ncbi:MAG: tRNA dihydrouridine synthase DusB [Deltaproteobacteria bacterium]|nr:tRNA dihydrouridine synthase DusB [Deltaproteobacteria bacterium]